METPPKTHRWRVLGHCLVAALLTWGLVGCATEPERSPWIDDAEAALAAGDRVSAVAFYESALAETPDDPAVQARLALLLIEEAEAHRAVGNHALAVDRFARADRLAGDTVHRAETLLAWADSRNALGASFVDSTPLLERVVDVTNDPTTQTDVARTLALGYDRAGELEQAVQWYRVLTTELEPDEALAIELRVGQLQAELGDVEAATSTLRAYVDASARAPAGLLAMAELHEEQGQIDDAEALRREVATLRPDSAAGWRQLFAFYQRTGNQTAADDVAATIAALREANQPPPRKMRPLRSRR